MKTRSIFYIFLFKNKHKELKNNVLFNSQSQLAKLAVTTVNTRFFQKKEENIRPLINQQLKEKGGKPIRNHRETYKNIVIKRAKEISPNISTEKLKSLLEKFDLNFSKETFMEVNPLKEKNKIFNIISSATLYKLKIVADAKGGDLKYDEFVCALKNLTK